MAVLTTTLITIDMDILIAILVVAAFVGGAIYFVRRSGKIEGEPGVGGPDGPPREHDELTENDEDRKL